MIFERFARTVLDRIAPPIGSPVLPAFALAPSQAETAASSPAPTHVVRERDDNLRDDWTDPGCSLEAREKPIHFRPLRPAIELNKAIDYFIGWANKVDFTGLFTAAEIDELWRRANDELGFAEIQPIFMRGALSERNLRVGKRRTMTPEYAAVGQRIDVQRGVLYRLRAVSTQVEHVPVKTPGEPDLIPGQGRSAGGLARREISYADAA